MKRTYSWPTLAGLAHPPLLGPICDSPEEWAGCYHESCALVSMDGRIRLAEGPACAAAEYAGECPHSSCLLVDPPQGDCRVHGWQLVTEHGSGPGFAGGRIFWALLACGHSDMDESGDVEAARLMEDPLRALVRLVAAMREPLCTCGHVLTAHSSRRLICRAVRYCGCEGWEPARAA